MEDHHSAFADSLGSVRDVPAEQLRQSLPALAQQHDQAGVRLNEGAADMQHKRAAQPGSRNFEVELSDGETTYSELFQAHTLRHAADAAETAKPGHTAVAVTLLDTGSDVRVRILGRCGKAGCREFVLETEHWQRTGDGELRCEDHNE